MDPTDGNYVFWWSSNETPLSPQAVLNENHTRTTLGCYLWNWYFLRFPKVLTGNLPFVVQDLCILQRFSKRFPESSKVPRDLISLQHLFNFFWSFWGFSEKLETKTETLLVVSSMSVSESVWVYEIPDLCPPIRACMAPRFERSTRCLWKRRLPQ